MSDSSPILNDLCEDLEQIGEVLRDEMPEVSPLNRTLEHIETADNIEPLIRHLEARGINYVCDDVDGESVALILEADHFQILRIARTQRRADDKSPESPRLDRPYIVQPTMVMDDLPGYHIEVLPKVHTLQDIIDDPELAAEYGWGRKSDESPTAYKIRLHTSQEMRDLESTIANDGKLYRDLYFANVAIVKNREGGSAFLVLDPDCVVEPSQCPNADQVSQKMRNTGTPRDLHYYADAQAYHLEQLELEKGKIKTDGDAAEVGTWVDKAATVNGWCR